MLVRALFVAIECVGEDGFVRLQPDLKSSGQLSFGLEFGGGEKARMYQRLSVDDKNGCIESITSNWSFDLARTLVVLHEGYLVASQDAFGTHLWDLRLPKNRVKVLGVMSDN